MLTGRHTAITDISRFSACTSQCLHITMVVLNPLAQPPMHDMIGAAKVPTSVLDEHQSPAAVEYEKGGKYQRRLISDISKLLAGQKELLYVPHTPRR